MNLLFIALERMEDKLPTGLRGIGIALLTLLIPLAIGILMNIYQKRKDKEAEFAELDLHVILDKVLKIKCLLWYIALIFLPTLFWEISCGPFRLFESILSFIGIFFIGNIIFGVYSWVKGNEFKYRFSYLEDLKNTKKYEDMVTVWRSVWQTKNLSLHDEREFFKIFSATINSLLEK